MKNLKFLYLLVLFVSTQFCNTIFAQNSYRDSWQQPVKIMDSLNIVPAMIIGEAGTGDGYFTFYLSNRVGEKGRVYANDIDKDVLKEIELKCKNDKTKNITTILGKIADPLFPKNRLDMVIMMRAFHDFTQPIKWMENVIPSLKQNSRLVIIDLDPDRAGYGNDHFLTKGQIVNIMKKTDFELIKIYKFLSRDNIYVFKLKENK